MSSQEFYGRGKGALVSMATGKSSGFALNNLQARGRLMISSNYNLVITALLALWFGLDFSVVFVSWATIRHGAGIGPAPWWTVAVDIQVSR